MKAKRFAPLLTLLILLHAPLAHAYSIQVTYNTNLRAAPSLQGQIVETVTAGAILSVVGSNDGWLRINRNGNEVWMSKSVSYTRVEGGESAAPRTNSSAQVDNCCFVDRQCATDKEWTSGYRAFQNGQCSLPIRSLGQATSEEDDNCCYLGWQCDTDEEWVSGYWAYQRNDQCAVPSQQQWQQGRGQRQQNGNQQGSQQQQQSRQQQQEQQEQQDQQQQQSRQQQQEQQDQQQQQEPKTEDPSDKQPSGDLTFIPLTEEEWRQARCEIYGGPSCD